MSTHALSAPISSFITAACTNTGGKMKGSCPRAADRCPFVPRHSKSGCLFHDYSSGGGIVTIKQTMLKTGRQPVGTFVTGLVTFMMTPSNGNIFRVTGPFCGEFTGPGEFPTQRPVTRIFDVFFDLRLNKRLSKQPWGWWFETKSRSLWRHRNDWPSHPELCLSYISVPWGYMG